MPGLAEVGDPLGDGRVRVEEQFHKAVGVGVGEVAAGELGEGGGEAFGLLDLAEDEEVRLSLEMPRLGRLEGPLYQAEGHDP